MNTWLFLVVLLYINQAICTDDKIVKARIESCAGCSLKRLPEVKQFIYDDVPKYRNVEFKKIPGAPPELIFLNESDEEIERFSLSELSREDCNVKLLEKGFKLKIAPHSEL